MFCTKHCFEKKIKMIGNHSRLRDVMGQFYPIQACTDCANHAHARYSSVRVTFGGSSKHSLQKQYQGKKLDMQKVSSMQKNIIKKIVETSHHLKRRGRKVFVEPLFSRSSIASQSNGFVQSFTYIFDPSDKIFQLFFK